MRHHARAQALAPESEQAIENAKERDLHARFDPLIAVGNAEKHGLQKQSHPYAVRERLELFLEVAAKDEFFADAGADGNADPQHDFQRAPRQKSLDGSGMLGPEPAVPGYLEEHPAAPYSD